MTSNVDFASHHDTTENKDLNWVDLLYQKWLKLAGEGGVYWSVYKYITTDIPAQTICIHRHTEVTALYIMLA